LDEDLGQRGEKGGKRRSRRDLTWKSLDGGDKRKELDQKGYGRTS